MKKLDKKQVPQVVILVVLSIALFGYFAKTMIMPSPASAKSATSVAAAPEVSRPAERAVTPEAPAVSVSETDVPAPPAVVRDPFAQDLGKAATGMVPPAAAPPSTGTRVASLPPSGIMVPSAPALPFPAMGIGAPGRAGAESLPPLPVAPPWTVTGVLQSGGERIVILRSGEARRIVKQGDFVDNQFQVVKVTRSTVVLRSDRATFTLPLGGSPTASKGKSGVQATTPTLPAALTAPVPSPVPSLLPTPRMVPPAVRQDISQSKAVRRSLVSMAPRELPAALYRSVLIKPVVKVADSRTEWKNSLKTQFPGVNWNQTVKTHVHKTAPKLAAFVIQKPAPVNVFVPSPALTIKPMIRKPALSLKVVMRSPASSVAIFDPADEVSMTGMPTAGTFAPEFNLPTFAGPRVSLSDLHGRVVVLNFWASWVPGCFKEMSDLRTLQSTLGGRGLSVLNINTWDTADAATAVLNRLPALAGQRLYDQLYDPSVSNESVAVGLYHAPDVPTLYVINRDGTIAATFVGFSERTLASLKQALKSLDVF